MSKMIELRKMGALAIGAAFLLMGASSVWAEETDDFVPPDVIPGDFSGFMMFATEYNFRGISQTSQDPAVQAEIDYSIDTGFYGISWWASIWGSNIDWDLADDETRMNVGAIELDYITGVHADPFDVSVDVGFWQYHFPGTHSNLQFDFWEVFGWLGYDLGYFSVAGSLYYSPDYSGAVGDSIYYAADVSVPVYKSLALNGHFGSTWHDGDGSQGEPWANGGEDYTDIKISATATIHGFDWELAYIDTFGWFGGNSPERAVNMPDDLKNIDGSRWVATISHSF